MRIVSIGERSTCRVYRSTAPLHALQGLGHEVIFVDSPPKERATAANDPRHITGADVILAYRRLYDNVRLVRQGMANGAAMVWDTDDDLANIPKESGTFRAVGRAGVERDVTQCTQLARMADIVTTTNTQLARKYQRLGARRVIVIDNHLPDVFIRDVRRERADDTITIGWVAAEEHRVDAKRVPIVKALRRIMAEHPNVRVETAGIVLPLPSDRYTRYRWVDITRFADLMARWDIGIAPLADVPFNRARSDVKLKEYGASGLPWLASPVGPYLEKGAEQGGRLVRDHEWYEQLDALVRDRQERMALGARAFSWAQTQTMSHVAVRWEQICEEAMERRRRRAAR